MKQKRFSALLLALALFAGLMGCARKSRRPALPAAPLQPAFTADEADTGGERSGSAAPTMKSAMGEAANVPAVEQTTEELLDAFTEPLEDEDALYQDYVAAHRAQYKMLRQRPEEVIELVLPALLSDESALECYTDETSRTTLFYCLFKDTLQKEPFSWDEDSYRLLSDMLAEFIQFVSEKELTEADGWFTENAPLTGLCAAVMKSRPALRLNMTPCETMTNAQALTNAKRVFAAVLEGTDAETFGFDAWPEDAANGFDYTTEWTLSQSEAGAVTLTATDPDTKEAASLTYTPNEAELHSILSGYGTLALTGPDGEVRTLRASNADKIFTPASNTKPIQDYELVLDNGVEIGMDYNTVLALLEAPHRVLPESIRSLESRGVLYGFYYDENLILRLNSISFRFAEDTVTAKTSELPAARGIALGESMQSVFSKMPAYDTTLKKWAEQEIYGWADPAGGKATLSFVADSFYFLTIVTPGGRVFSITFARLDGSVKWMDIS